MSTHENETIEPPAIRWEELTVNEAIRRYPGAVTVFNAFGIDACGGAVSIAEAAERDGADLEDLVAALVESASAET